MSESASLSTSSSKQSVKSSLKSVVSTSDRSDANSPSTSTTHKKLKPVAKKPTWMDASLPDEKRFKAWNKEREKQLYGRGGTAGYFTSFYKRSWAWWI